MITPLQATKRRGVSSKYVQLFHRADIYGYPRMLGLSLSETLAPDSGHRYDKPWDAALAVGVHRNDTKILIEGPRHTGGGGTGGGGGRGAPGGGARAAP